MTTTTTPSTASQAPAVSIDSEEFRELLGKMYGRTSFNYLRPNEETQAVIAHIDAKLEQARAEGFEEMRQAMAESAKLMASACRRATAAEAKLEAIRQGVEGLTRWDDNLGMCPIDYGPWIARTEVLSLLQPQEPEPEPKVKYIGGPVEVRITRYKLADPAQPQADESGLPG